jgi:hypothetical protein
MATKRATLRRQSFVEVPTRALLFLRGLAANAEIRAELAESGYRAEDHAEGVALLSAIVTVDPSDSTWRAGKNRLVSRAEVAAFARTKLRAADVVLRRRHPAEHKRLFRGIDAVDDPAFAVTTFFAAIEELEKRGDAKAALATIESLGITRELRQRLDMRRLPPARATAKGDSPDEAAVLALREWYQTWASLARDVLESRESRIRLGLVRRRRHDTEERELEDATTA